MHAEDREVLLPESRSERAHREVIPGGWWSDAVVPAFRGTRAMLAVVLVLVVTVWRGVAAAGGHWTQDDFVSLSQASTQGLTNTFLGGSHTGEFSVPARFLAWCVQALTQSSWSVVALVATLLTLLIGALGWVVLTQLLESRWVRLPLLALLCFAPLGWAGTLHFMLLLIHLPTLVLFLTATSVLLHHVQAPTRATAWGGVAALVLMLVWSDQSILLSVAVFLIVLGDGVARAGGLGAGWSAVVGRHPGLWVTAVVGVIGRLVLMAARDTDGLGLPDDVATAVRTLEVLVRQSVIGLVGGPWTGEVQGTQLVASANWPTALAVLLCLAGLGVMLRSVRTVEVRFTLAAVVSVVVVAWLVLVVTNNAWNAVSMGPRTAAVLVPAVLLLVAVGLRGTVIPERLRNARLFVPGGAAVLLAAVVVAATVPTASLLVPSLQNPDDREYVDRLRAALAIDPSVVILDGPVPDGVLHLSLGEYAKVSTLAPVLPHEPFFDRPSSALRIVDGWGDLQPVVVGDPVDAAVSEDESCGYPIRGGITSVPLEEPVGTGTYLVQIDYFTNASSTMSVATQDGALTFPVREGLRSVQFPWETDGAAEIGLSLASDTDTVCVDLQVGSAVAESDAPKSDDEKADDEKADDEKAPGPVRSSGPQE